MASITITTVSLNKIPFNNTIADFFIKVTGDPDLSYSLVGDDIAIQPDGTLVTPLVISGLTEESYTIKVSMVCSGVEFAKVFLAVFPNMCESCSLVMDITPGISTISAGELTSSECTVGDYSIEWRLGSSSGDIQFVSGSDISYDAEISITHPFTDEIIESGTIYPVIRSVILDSIEYTTVEGGLTTCISSEVVTALACDNGNGPFTPENTSSFGDPATTYSTGFEYINNTGGDSPSRSFKFYTSNTDRYVAFYFSGEDVYDTVRITHVSGLDATETLLEYFDNGANETTDFTTTPIQGTFWYYMREYKKIMSLVDITYNSGDYLRVEIIANPTNPNTIWRFYITCLESVNYLLPTRSEIRTITGTPTMVTVTSPCGFELTYGWDISALADINIYRSYSSIYGINQYSGGIVNFYDTYSEVVSIFLYSQYVSYSTPYQTQCADLIADATWNFTRAVGNAILTASITFTNATDYSVYKAKLVACMAAITTGFINDPSVIEYYKHYFIAIRTAPNQCGDTKTEWGYIYNHILNPPVYDDGLQKVTFTKDTGFTGDTLYAAAHPSSTCNSRANNVTALSNNFRNWPNTNFSAILSVVTQITDQLYGYNPFETQDNLNPHTTERNLWIKDTDLSIVDVTPYLATVDDPNYGIYYLNMVNDSVVFTDSGDPVNNWQWYRLIPVSNDTPFGSPYLVYEVIAGVVTTNNITAYNAT